MNLSFIKLDINIMNDTKIKIIRKMPDGDSILILWIGIICIGMKSGKTGFLEIGDGIPFTSETLSTELDIKLNTVKLGLETFVNLKMIEVLENGEMYLKNFEKHQEIEKIEKIKEKSRIRSANYRKKQRLISNDNEQVRHSDEQVCNSNEQVCNSDDTIRHATDKDIDIDIEKDKNLNEEENNFDAEINFFVSDFIKKVKLSYPTTSPKITVKTKYNYCDSVDKLIRIDGFKFPYIQKVILFAIEDSFLSQNIKSLANIRKKWKNDLTAFQNCVDKFEKNKKNEKPQNHLGSAYQEWNGGKL